MRRDFATLIFSLITPLLQMFLLGFGIDTNIRQLNTVVYDADGRRQSRELLDRLRNSDTFRIAKFVNHGPGLERGRYRWCMPCGY